MDELALMYLLGHGTAVDLVEGAAWMALATERGVKRPEDSKRTAMPEYQAQVDAIRGQGLKRASELRLLIKTPTDQAENLYVKEPGSPSARPSPSASPTPSSPRQQSGSRAEDTRPSASPSPSARLAKPGTYFLLQYASVKTDRGVYGFEPGHEVHFVRSLSDKGTLVVSDGKCELEIAASQLTNDLDVAMQLAQADAATQAQIVSRIQTENSAASARQHELDVTRSRDVEAAEKQRTQNSRLRATPNPLDP